MAETDIELKVGLDNKDAVAKSKELQTEIQKVFNKTDGKKLDASTKNLLSNMSKLSDKASTLQKKMEDLGNTKTPTEEYKKLEDELGSLTSEFDKALDKQEQLEGSQWAHPDQVTKAREETDKLAESIDKTRQKMDELVDSGKAFTLGSDTDQYSNLEHQLEGVNNQMDVTLVKSQEMEGGFERMQGSSNSLFGRLVNGFQNIARQTETAGHNMQALGARMIQSGGEGAEAIGKMAQSAGAATAELGAGMSTVASTASAAVPIIGGITAAVTAVGTAVKKVVDQISKSVAEGTRMIVGLTDNLRKSIPILKQVSDAAFTALHPGKMIATLKSGLGAAGNIVKSGLSSIANVVNKGLSSIMSNVKSSISEGISALEKWELAMGHTNNTITTFKNSLSTLRVNIGVAFAPILDTVSPILMKLISILNQAAVSVGSFFAALGGKTTIKIAKSSTASMSGVASSTNRVSRAAAGSKKTLGESAEALQETGKQAEKADKKLENFLGSYDELNVLGKENEEIELPDIEVPEIDPDDITGGGGSGGGGGGVSADVLFEEIDIDGGIQDLVNKIRKAWERDADFTWLGQLLGERLKGILEFGEKWFDDVADPFAKKLGKAIATFLNGFFETEGLGNQLGRTIASAFGTILDGINQFVDNFHFDSFGEFIKDMINGALDKWEEKGWDETLANTISGLINGAADFVIGLFAPGENNPFTRLGDHLGTLLALVVTQIDFKKIGEAFADIINSGVDLVHGILDNRRTFWNLGNGLGDLLNKMSYEMIQNGTWAKLGDTFADGITDAFLVLAGFLTTWNPTDLEIGIAQAINTAVENVDMNFIMSTLSELATTLMDTLAGIIEGIDTEELGNNIAGAIEGIDVDGMLSSFLNLAHTIASKLLDTLITALQKLRTDGAFTKLGYDLYEGLHSVEWGDIFSKLGEVIKLALGGLLEGIGGYLLGVIKGWYQKVPFLFKGLELILGVNFEELFTALENNEKPLAEQAGEVIGDAVGDSLVNSAEESSRPLPENVSPYVQAVVDDTGNIVGELPDTLSTPLDETKNAIQNAFSEAKNDVALINGELKTETVTAMTTLKDEVAPQIEAFKTSTETAFTSVKNTVVGEDGASGAVGAVKSGVTSAFTEVNTSVTTNSQAASTNAQTSFNTMKDNTVGEAGSITTMNSEAKRLATEMQTGVTTDANTLKTNVETSMTGMNTSVTGAGGTIPQMSKNLSNQFTEMQTKISGKGGVVPEMNKSIGDSFTDMFTNLKEISNNIKKSVVQAFKNIKTKVAGDGEESGFIPKVKKVVINCFKNMKSTLVDEGGLAPTLKKKIVEAFKQVRNKLVGSGGTGGFAKDIEKGVLNAADALKRGLHSKLNSMLSDLQKFCNNTITAINSMIDAYNALAESQNGGASHVSDISVPQLANGAVLPPNKPFLAMVGDQKSGTNVEAPLSTIQEAVANVLEPYLAQIAENTRKTADKDLTVKIGDRDIARANQRGQRGMGLQLRTS